MPIPDRLYNIAKAQLGKAMDRWEEIDVKAQQEIDQFMARHADNSNLSPMQRAMNKINAASAQSELRSGSSQIDDAQLQPEPSLEELEAKIAAERAATSSNQQASSTASQGSPTQRQTLLGAYKILGVEPGADLLTVQAAYQKLRERAAPERFADGSPEQVAARNIQKRIDAAFMMLSNVLAPSGDRFGRLEI